MRLHAILLLGLKLLPVILCAGTRTLSKRIEKPNLTVDAVTTVKDSYIPPTTPNYHHHSNVVLLNYHRSLRTDVAANAGWKYRVVYEITFSSSGLSKKTDSLMIEYYAAAPVYEAYKEYANGNNEASVKVIGVRAYNPDSNTWTSNTAAMSFIPSDIHLELYVNTEEYKYLDYVATITTAGEYHIGPDQFEVDWRYVEGAEEYELEWAFLDAEANTNPTEAFKQAIRVRTSNQYYLVDNTYPNGKIYFRVRAIGRQTASVNGDYTHLKSTPWSTPFSMTIGTEDIPAFEKDKNWSYTSNYAEEGKSKQTVNYYDGSLRSRQSVTSLSSDLTTMVAETKYDFEGRPAVSMLPVPIPGTALSYIPGFNKNGDNDSYSRYDFDIGAGATSLKNTTGAGQYYSGAFYTGLKDINSGYIPDAEGYPFTQTEYTKDNSGRVKRQSGVGDSYRLGSERETFHFYGNTDETDLHRMFGSNVGVADHYRKEADVDHNGQVSVRYIDMQGRVVATALAGDCPANVLPLSGTFPMITKNLNKNNRVDSAAFVSRSVSAILNVVKNTTYSFTYDLTGVINSSGTPYNICAECVYDLMITITDPDGLPVPLDTGSNNVDTLLHTFSADTVICSNTEYTPDEIKFDAEFLKLGDYTVTKTLALNKGAIDGIIANLDTMDVFPNLDSMIADYIADIDSTICDNSCEQECREWLTYSQETFTGEELAACIAQNCGWGYVNGRMDTMAGQECATLRHQMEYDFSPPNGWLYLRDDTLEKYTDSVETGYANADSIRKHWEHGWARKYAKYHPEYCHYSRCKRNKPSRVYEYRLATVQTWSEAIDSGFIDPVDYVDSVSGDYCDSCPMDLLQDPYFTGFGEGADYIRNIKDSLAEFWADTQSLWWFVDPAHNSITQLYDQLHDPTLLSNTARLDTLRWQFFRSMYLGLKMDMQATIDQISGCGYSDDNHTIVQDPRITPRDSAGMSEAAIGGIEEDCEQVCAYNAEYWVSQLYSQCEMLEVLDSLDSLELIGLFEDYCNDHCGFNNPFGIITWEDINAGNLDEVETFMNEHEIGCYWEGMIATTGNHIMINDSFTQFIDTECAQIIDTCLIQLVDFANEHVFEGDYVYSLSPTCFPGAAHLHLNHGEIRINWETLGYDSCAWSIIFYDRSGNRVNNVYGLYDLQYSPFSPVGQMLAPDISYLRIKGKRTWEYDTMDVWLYLLHPGDCEREFINSACESQPYLFIIPAIDSVLISTFDTTAILDSCLSSLIDEATYFATKAWEDSVKELELDVMWDHFNKCFNDPFQEDFYYRYQSKEHHYTLNYFDQADNLVQTVPPAGVDLLDSTAFYDNGTYKNTSEPDHHLKTNYRYNSLNQVIWQQTPDAGITRFFYDEKGLLRASQNAKQLAESSSSNAVYSYTKYDPAGRITEVGQIEDFPDTLSATIQEGINASDFPEAGDYVLAQRTKTEYDNPASGTTLAQANLRNRVSAVRMEETEGTQVAATFYSYDAPGNVNHLAQKVKGMEKQMKYDYDLLSGNVNKVYYAPGTSERLTHEYEYDADNRLTNVFTSTDDLFWAEDARYFYYKHGPLSREEIGDDKLQGRDYYYTLQGWLKGVNQVGQLATLDPGKDADSTGLNLNEYISKDEMSFALSYNKHDYTPRSTSVTLPDQINDSWSQLSAEILDSGLYNGNIAWMMTEIPELAFHGARPPLQALAYQFDQLNRLKQSRRFTYGSQWYPSQAYREDYSYDPNGNIDSLVRYGILSTETGVLMDSLQYTYQRSGGWLVNNRLDSLRDLYHSTASGREDINYASPNDYSYDEIGNLIQDPKEEIDTIKWTVYGKVKEIIRTDTSEKDDIEFIYDGMGNRVEKIVKPYNATGPNDWEKEFYVRDATGNIMATYQEEVVTTPHPLKGIMLREQPIYGSSRIGVFYRDQHLEEPIMFFPETRREEGEKVYELTNHLGNVLATIKDFKLGHEYGTPDDTADVYTAVVSSMQDYYAGGMLMPGRNYTHSEKYRFGFQNDEKDDEISGTGNHYVFGGYGLDVRLGRRWNTDPEISSMPSLSSYAVFKNNPIMFIDPSGRIPYPITIRGFAPFKSFGFGFHGDDRGYSTGDVTARVHQKINFDTDKTQIKTTAWSSPSFRTSDPHNQKTATPEVKFEGDFTIKQNGDNKTFGFGTHVAAGNPLTPQALTPNIDIFSNFSITENKKAGMLNISGKLTGDNFPSTEAFISDPSGQNVFIGVGQIGAGVGQNTGPFTELPGENSTRPITDFNFSITTDKKGNFTGVKQGDKTFSIGDWNNQFTDKPTQKKEE